jgi:hypothetical protein
MSMDGTTILHTLRANLMSINDYIHEGKVNRAEYFKGLAEYFEIEVEVVLRLAAKLGKAQDLTGLIDAIEDHVGGFGK